MPGRKFSTHNNETNETDALHDGIPSWMESSINAWLRLELRSKHLGESYANVPLVQRLERHLKQDLTGGSGESYAVMKTIFNIMNQNEMVKLDVVEGLLNLNISTTRNSGQASLEEILIQSGSKWQVAEINSEYTLQERVDETVAVAVESLSEQEGDASEYLIKAWNSAFGRSPDPSAAYNNAIKAVESASWQIVVPSDRRATLGSIIRKLKDHSEEFQVAVDEKTANNALEGIWRNMSTIWDGQTDRHATAQPIVPTQKSSEQAVIIALSISQQFSRGLITSNRVQ